MGLRRINIIFERPRKGFMLVSTALNRRDYRLSLNFWNWRKELIPFEYIRILVVFESRLNEHILGLVYVYRIWIYRLGYQSKGIEQHIWLTALNLMNLIGNCLLVSLFLAMGRDKATVFTPILIVLLANSRLERRFDIEVIVLILVGDLSGWGR